jgi:hypothetical protein
MSDVSDLVRRVRECAAQQTETLPACVTDEDIAACRVSSGSPSGEAFGRTRCRATAAVPPGSRQERTLLCTS